MKFPSTFNPATTTAQPLSCHCKNKNGYCNYEFNKDSYCEPECRPLWGHQGTHSSGDHLIAGLHAVTSLAVDSQNNIIAGGKQQEGGTGGYYGNSFAQIRKN